MTNVIDINTILSEKELSEKEILKYRIKCFQEHINYLSDTLRAFKLEIKHLENLTEHL